jgi:hypothetical protein
MSPRSKLVYLLLALIVAFTSLAGGAFALSHAADISVNLQQIDAASQPDSSLNSPVYSIAGDCDVGVPTCG